MFEKALLEESSNLAFEVWLAAECNRLARVGLDHLESRHAFLVASEAESMADHHLLDEVVLGVLDHPECHNVKECVSIGVWHHRVSTCLSNQFLKRLSIELGRSDVDG